VSGSRARARLARVFGGALVVAAAAIVVTPAPARANPVDLFGFGARGQAMGGAEVAAAEDTSASYYNPALLVRSSDIRIDVGYQLAVPHLTIDGRDTGVDVSRGMALGLAVPGRLLGARLAVGAGVFLPDQQITRTRTLASERPRFVTYDNRPQRLFLAANIALELPGDVSIGGGIAYMSSTQGTVELDGLVAVGDPEASDLDLAIDVDLRTIRYPQAGVAWRARPWLTIAASYRGGFKLVLDQTFVIKGDVGAPGSPPLVEDGFLNLRSRAQDLFQPAQLTVGASAQLTPRFLLAFDLAWHRWSKFENPAAHIDFTLDLGDFNDLVDIPPQSPVPAPHFHDIAVPRLGGEYTFATGQRRWRARGGYVYEPSPAPVQRAATNLIDNPRHTLSAGVGVEVPGLAGVILRPVAIDLGVAVTMLAGRQHDKLTAADPIGDYRSGGAVVAASLATRWRF
jgi:long-chain fatty acid transport protein